MRDVCVRGEEGAWLGWSGREMIWFELGWEGDGTRTGEHDEDGSCEGMLCIVTVRWCSLNEPAEVIVPLSFLGPSRWTFLIHISHLSLVIL